MSDPGYLAFVWNHVLRGARLEAVLAVPRGYKLTFRCPEALATTLSSETLQLELHTREPLVVGWADSDASLLDALLQVHALYVPPPEPGLGLWLGADPEEEGSVHLRHAGGLASLTTDTGKRLSQMKVSSLGRDSSLTQRGLVDTPVLIARRREALSAIAAVLRAAGFRWGEALSFRADPEVAQAIEVVHSRWNTYLGLSFHFRFHAAVATLAGHTPRTALALYAPELGVGTGWNVRTSRDLRHPDEGNGVYLVDQQTRPDALAEVLIRDFERTYLPFLESVREPDGIRRVFGVRP
jgi:hypothetical protein